MYLPVQTYISQVLVLCGSRTAPLHCARVLRNSNVRIRYSTKDSNKPTLLANRASNTSAPTTLLRSSKMTPNGHIQYSQVHNHCRASEERSKSGLPFAMLWNSVSAHACHTLEQGLNPFLQVHTNPESVQEHTLH